MNRTLVLLGILYIVPACSSGGDTDGGTSTGGATTGTSTSGTTSGTTTGNPMPVARVRVGALSPNMTAFDYCLAPTGTQDYIGPIMVTRSVYGGLTYPSVSDYSSVNPGTYDLAIVQPGQLSCTSNDAGSPSTIPIPMPLAGNTSYTVALLGLASTLDVRALVDDTSTDKPAILRFISGKLGSPNLDMTVTGSSTPVFSNLPYATVATMSSNIDANGYADLGASGTYTLSFSVSGSNTPLLVAPGISFTGGSYSSVFTIPPPTGYSGSLSAFVCFDSQQPIGGMANCLAFPVP
jgi:hypothetical protein